MYTPEYAILDGISIKPQQHVASAFEYFCPASCIFCERPPNLKLAFIVC